MDGRTKRWVPTLVLPALSHCRPLEDEPKTNNNTETKHVADSTCLQVVSQAVISLDNQGFYTAIPSPIKKKADHANEINNGSK